MKIGFVGLGKMGLNMVTRLIRDGHEIIVHDLNTASVEEAVALGADPAISLSDLVKKLPKPQVIWIMVPAGNITNGVLEELSSLLPGESIVVDGGNSNFHDTVSNATKLSHRKIHLLDVGTSGGIWGLDAGYCMMAGGNRQAFDAIKPIMKSLAPPEGYLYVGKSGAGHYLKMIHNGIEYAMMQAYAEGFEILEKSDYDYDLEKVCHLWNQGSVVRSWLLELAENAFSDDAHLENISDYVDDSGEGRWTVLEAIDKDVPALSIVNALMTRFRSRQDESFSAKVLAALRNQFGGHPVKDKNSGE
ncbi:MAG: phosphogluconate dehydrogenase (NAD(+)-dependent, decarboxylating) [Candidatus Zixiibacteriota bacterium]